MPATATDTADRMTLAEAAALAGRSEKTVARWVARRLLPATRALGRVYVCRSDVLRLLAGEPTTPTHTGD